MRWCHICARRPNEINDYNVPYGFFSYRGDEFTVFFDVKMNQEQAANMLEYMKSGFFLNSLTVRRQHGTDGCKPQSARRASCAAC